MDKLDFESFSVQDQLDRVLLSLVQGRDGYEGLSQGDRDVLKSVLIEKLNQTSEPDSTNLVSMVKAELIEMASESGFCYVKLVPTIPFFLESPITELTEGLTKLKSNLGQNPLGSDVLSELCVLSQALCDSSTGPSDDLRVSNNVDIFKTMISSRCRFEFSNKNGVKHIGKVSVDGCACEDILCKHGWSSKYVFSVLSSQNVRIGATIDLDDIFNEITEDGGQIKSDIMPRETFQDHKIDELFTENEKLARQMTDLMLENQALKSRGTNLKTPPDSPETLLPGDSSSVAERYEKHFLDDGTVYTMNRRGHTELTVSNAVTRPVVIKDVVRGFMKTKEMEMEEMSSNKKVAPINGLANPFKDQRLNLLCHFDTAVRSVKSSQDCTTFESLSYIKEYKPQTPTQELARQIIIRTFDFRKRVVIANPFRLPFIEVGMLINDSTVGRCFSMLQLEYKMIWFQQMKSLMMPTFHDSYDCYRETKLSGSKHSSSDKRQKSTRESSKSSRSNSIFSLRN